jgi:hypothetical protein
MNCRQALHDPHDPSKGSPLEARFLSPASARTLPVSGRPVRGKKRPRDISAGMADSRLSQIEGRREKSQVPLAWRIVLRRMFQLRSSAGNETATERSCWPAPPASR